MNKKDRNKIRPSASDLSLRLTAIVVSVLFAVLMLYPLFYTVISSIKDNSSIYEMPPKLLPKAAQSLTVTLDYNGTAPEVLEDTILRDSVQLLFGIADKYPTDALFEIKLYGTQNGKTVFYQRVHQTKLQMERDYGIYKGTVAKPAVLLFGDRYLRAAKQLGYHFDPNGLSETPVSPEKLNTAMRGKLQNEFLLDFPLSGTLIEAGTRQNSLLLLESYVYYLQMPAYAYQSNAMVVQYGFTLFVFNSVIVIGWAILTQCVLCSVCAFVISRMLSVRTGRIVLLFFLGAMMIPFASIMLPQLIMYRQIGAYNNYAALLLPFLYPFGFYIYLYKGFFDKIPGSYFEAARLDGASELYLYSRICMPLSKPIIALIALQTFISNWNDFFWAWMVTEDQRLWTLNVALYNLSINKGTKQNAIMGLSIITIMPVIIISIFFSRQLKQSIMSSGVKG